MTGRRGIRRPYFPVDIWLALRMASWSLLLPVLKRLLPIKTLARLMWSEGRRAQSPDREREIVWLSSVVARLRPPSFESNCLERSLLAYRYLAQVNADPHLVIAVSPSENGLVGHAWVTIDNRPVHDSAAAIRPFVSIGEFGARGLLLEGNRERSVDQVKTWA